MNKKPLIIITGPTAVGKTETSIRLAKAIGGEIISADSMQVYRHMDIGTAKVTKKEMEGVLHHLIDILEPDEEFNIYLFKEYAKKAIEDIYDRGHIPIIAGGTGFYIQSILYDIEFDETEPDTTYRKELEEIAIAQGAEYVHSLLGQIDPESAKAIHANNVKRVIRALEYNHQTGQLMSEHNKEQKEHTSPYNFIYLVLNDNRDEVYKRIDKRVDIMIEEGLVDEVTSLVNKGYDRSLVSMQGLGYKEIIDYLEGNTTLEEAVYIIKRDTRRFAKRQLTWFRREKDVTFVNINEYNYDKQLILNSILDMLKDKKII